MNKIILILWLISSTLSMASTFKYGLKSKDNQPLQLLDLQTRATIEGPYAQIEYTQTYKNPYDKPLETEFYFPRTETSVFYKFEAIFQNQTIVGQIFEKQKAKEMYEWNVERGNTVAYSERNALVPDVMQILVGNIPAHESVDIRFSVIQPLEVIINKFWGFTLPSVLTERYAPVSVDPSETPNIVNVGLEDSVYKEWKVFVEIISDTPFGYIANPSHKLKPELSESASKVYKAIWDVTIVPNKDFTVYFRSEKLEVPSVILATHPNYTNDHVLLVNFVPELNSLSIKDSEQKLENSEEGFLELAQLALEEDIQNAKGEFIFVIDRSGSMHERRINNLKKALVKFFQILPKDSYFNIVSFGSSFSYYRDTSVKYTAETLQEVMNWIPSINSDMGGTEILTAIERASSLPMTNGYPRTIMLLTDGDVYNPNEVVNHVLTHSNKMRFCGVGIGYGASEYLIKNFGKAGKCTSVFVQEDEDIGEKAIFMIKAAVSRYIENIDFSISCVDKNNKEIYNQEEKVGMLLKDVAFKKWVYIQDLPEIKSCQIKLEYFNSLREEQLKEEVEANGFQTAEVTDVWHKIAYDALIRDLDLRVKSNQREAENIEDIKAQIVKQSLKYQVLTDYTAFLAVIQETDQDNGQDRLRVTIPNLDSADYTTQESLPMRGRVMTAQKMNRMNSKHIGRVSYESMASSAPSGYGGAQYMNLNSMIPQFDADEVDGARESVPVDSASRNLNSAPPMIVSQNVTRMNSYEKEDEGWFDEVLKRPLILGLCLSLAGIIILYLKRQRKNKTEPKKEL